MSKFTLRGAIAALAILAASAGAFAQGFPDRPITMIVPFPPGGVADQTGRPTGAAMEKFLKQPVVISNRAGDVQAYRKAVLSGFSNVEQALIAVQQTTEAERIQGNVVRSSRRAFELSEQQFKAGTLNLVTLLQTEETLFTAEDQLVQVRLARLLATVSLFQALGGGWPPSITTISG